MNGPMSGWMDVTKNAEAHERGAGSSSWTFVWSLSLWVLILVSVFFFFFFFKFLVQSYWRKGGVAQKILQTWRQSGTVLSLPPPFRTFKVPSFPPPRSLWSHFKSCRYDTKSFFFVFFSFLTVSWREGRKKKTRWCPNESEHSWLSFARISVKHLHHPPFSKLLSNSFHLYSTHHKTVERYCERSTGTKDGDGSGDKEHTCINDGRTGAVMKRRDVSVLESHSKPVMEKKRRLASCLQRLFTTRSEKKLMKNQKKRERKYSAQPKGHFLQHCSSFLD